MVVDRIERTNHLIRLRSRRGLPLSGILLVVAACYQAIGGAPASAATIYENGTPFIGLAAGAYFADVDSTFTEVADNFSLSPGMNVIRDIHWWGIYGTGTVPSSDDFTITIYQDDSGAPGAVESAVTLTDLERAATASMVTGQTVYAYSADISPISLLSGTTYWLGISNDSGGNNWGWVQSNPFSGLLYQYSASNMSFGARADEVAFYLTNDVPEPSSAVLAAGGAIAAAFFFARRRVSPGRPHRFDERA